MNKNLKKTPLHNFHVSQGANMASFGNYHMPLWYPTGAKAEHLSVINDAGLFDTSHMAVISVEGKNSRQLLQHCFTKDLENCFIKQKPLVDSRSTYGIFLDQQGFVIDDAIIFQLSYEKYMVVVNAGMGHTVSTHLQNSWGGNGVTIMDHTDYWGKIDIQGPNSAKILQKMVTKKHDIFEKFPYFSFKGDVSFSAQEIDNGVALGDIPALLSRTGYTGEFGFEIFVSKDNLLPLWRKTLAAGKEFSLVVCGLAARDSLRAGAALPLSHQDIGNWIFANNPWPFALPHKDQNTTFSKEFIGSKALRSHSNKEYTYCYAGYDPRKIAPDKAHVTDKNKVAIGSVLTCTTDMAIGRVNNEIVSSATPTEKRPKDFTPRGLSCGFIRVTKELKSGDQVFLTDNKRYIKIEIRSDIRPDRTARAPIANFL